MSSVMFECEDGIDESAWERAMDRLPPRRPRFVHRIGDVSYWAERIYLRGGLLVPVYRQRKGVTHLCAARWVTVDDEGTLRDWPAKWATEAAVALRLWIYALTEALDNAQDEYERIREEVDGE